MDMWHDIDQELAPLRDDEANFESIRGYLMYQLRTHPEHCKIVLEKVLEIVEEKQYLVSKAWCLGIKGWYYHDRAQFDIALDYQIEAYYLFESLENKSGVLFVNNAIMGNYIALGIHESAINWGLKGLALAEEIKDERYLAIIMSNISHCYMNLGMYKEAKESYERYSALPYKAISLELEMTSLQLIAEIELYSGNIEKALTLINEASEITKQYELMHVETLRILGGVHCKLGDTSLAEQDYVEGLALADKTDSVDIKCKILHQYGKMLQRLNREEEMEKCLLESLALAEKLKLRMELLQIHEELSVYYKKKENYKKAFYHLEASLTYSKEVFSKQNSIEINNVQKNEMQREIQTYKSMYDRVAIISRIGQKITSNLKMSEILTVIYEEAKKIMEIDVFGIATYEEGKEMLSYDLFIEKGERVKGVDISIHSPNSLGAYCVREKKDVFINNMKTEYSWYIKKHKPANITNGLNPQAVIFCPLMIGDETKGFVTLQSYEKDVYTSEELNTLKALSSYIVIALENAKLFDKLEYSAKHDGLTGVWNRGEVMRIGEHAFKQYKEDNTLLNVAMFDLDFFKKVNDTYGHLAGDELLKRFTEVVRCNIKKNDSFGRYGGEEFLLILPQRSEEDSYTIVENIRKLIENEQIVFGDKVVGATVSIGLYSFKKGEVATFSEGVNKADEALYRAKAIGRNTVVEAR